MAPHSVVAMLLHAVLQALPLRRLYVRVTGATWGGKSGNVGGAGIARAVGGAGVARRGEA